MKSPIRRSTFTPFPTVSILGARMKVSGTGSGEIFGTGASQVKLSSWLPKLFRSHLDIDQTEMRLLPGERAGEEDRPRAGAPELHPLPEFPDDERFEVEDLQQAGEAGALAAGQDQPGQPVEILCLLDRPGLDAEALAGDRDARRHPPEGPGRRWYHRQGKGERSLLLRDSWNLSRGARYQPRPARSCSLGIAAISRPAIASPRPMDASRTLAGSLK